MRSSLLAVMLVLVFSISFLSQPVEAQTEEIQITIVYTHDIHSHMLPRWTTLGCSGGMALVSAKVNELRELGPILLLDCGDILSGGAINDLNNGLPMIEVMNAIGYDAMTLDNHEFDLDVPVLQGMISAANFEVLSANVDWPGTPKAAPYSVETIEDYQIGVIGLTPSFWYAPESVSFTNMATAANLAAAELGALGVNFIIVLGCVSSNLANSLSGVDLIVMGGGPEYVNGILSVPSAGSYASAVGVLDLTIDTNAGTIKDYSFSDHSLDSSLEPDDDITAIIDRWDEPLAEELDAPIGYFTGHQGVSEMAYHLAESILDYTGADIATYNYGGVRDSLDAGFITLRDLYHVEPFFNHISTLDLPGSTIQSIMGGNYYVTDVSSFDPETYYTVGSANFSIVSFERDYPGDGRNRQDFTSQTVVSTLADYLSKEYPITDSHILLAIDKVQDTIGGLSDSVFSGGLPSVLRTAIANELVQAKSFLTEENYEASSSSIQDAADTVSNHIISSCARRWLLRDLNAIFIYLNGLSGTSTATSSSTTSETPTTTVTYTTTDGANPILSSTWALVIVLEVTALAVILLIDRLVPRHK
ncbi:MAG: bifunctional metallophosphatase/5'-nucleotidase [Candidatus Thorarchaeota archaeon]|nr:bifunctional metallophosphatase/5'-nucleotidase [Candidatus Thorarchaeota archaeon]